MRRRPDRLRTICYGSSRAVAREGGGRPAPGRRRIVRSGCVTWAGFGSSHVPLQTGERDLQVTSHPHDEAGLPGRFTRGSARGNRLLGFDDAMVKRW